jgi:rod shape-determining protein MreC
VSLRDNPLGELKVPLTWAAAIALIVAVVAATAILLSDRRETFKAEAYGVSRKASDTVLAPVGDVLAAPGRWTGAGVDTLSDYFAAGSQNAQLKAQLKEMKQWRDVAIALKDENARYKTLLGLKTDPPIPMVAARIVTDSRGPFADTRLANTGAEHGVKVGNPVMSENGLVGRVIGVTSGASRVLLLTDIASRTPVMIDRTNARAILTGDGGPNPRLDYLRGHDPIREGDRLLTSGDGGVVPRGLPVGTAVKGLDGRWRVVLASDKAPIDFVRILLFQDFTQVVNQKELTQTPAPPPTPGPNGAEPVKGPEAVPAAKAVAAPVTADKKPDVAAKPATPAKPRPKPPAEAPR